MGRTNIFSATSLISIERIDRQRRRDENLFNHIIKAEVFVCINLIKRFLFASVLAMKEVILNIIICETGKVRV